MQLTTPCSIEKVDLNAGDGESVPGVRLTCLRCGHVTESFGQRGRSVKRCFKAMTEECPMKETDTPIHTIE
jgi:hypothetical protein